MPYIVVVLAGRQARLRPPPRLAQFLLGTFFNLSMGVQYEICFAGEIPLRGVTDGFHFAVRRSRTISPEGGARGFHRGVSRDFTSLSFVYQDKRGFFVDS